MRKLAWLVFLAMVAMVIFPFTGMANTDSLTLPFSQSEYFERFAESANEYFPDYKLTAPDDSLLIRKFGPLVTLTYVPEPDSSYGNAACMQVLFDGSESSAIFVIAYASALVKTVFPDMTDENAANALTRLVTKYEPIRVENTEVSVIEDNGTILFLVIQF